MMNPDKALPALIVIFGTVGPFSTGSGEFFIRPTSTQHFVIVFDSNTIGADIDSQMQIADLQWQIVQPLINTPACTRNPVKHSSILTLKNSP